jgi:hypothetical protein
MVGGVLASIHLLTPQNVSDGPRPLHHASRGPPPPYRGADAKQRSRSRDATASELVLKPHENFRSQHRSSSEGAGGGAGAVTICASSHDVSVRKKKEAERRKTLIRILCTLRYSSRLARRARQSAFHHGSCQRDASPQGSASGQASCDAVFAGVTRSLRSQSSDSTSRTGRNAGEHDARSRPRAAVTSRRPQAPHPAPTRKRHLRASFTANGIGRHQSFAMASVKQISGRT